MEMSRCDVRSWIDFIFPCLLTLDVSPGYSPSEAITSENPVAKSTPFDRSASSVSSPESGQCGWHATLDPTPAIWL